VLFRSNLHVFQIFLWCWPWSVEMTYTVILWHSINRRMISKKLSYWHRQIIHLTLFSIFHFKVLVYYLYALRFSAVWFNLYVGSSNFSLSLYFIISINIIQNNLYTAVFMYLKTLIERLWGTYGAWTHHQAYVLSYICVLICWVFVNEAHLGKQLIFFAYNHCGH